LGLNTRKTKCRDPRGSHIIKRGDLEKDRLPH
jgi:hypothetical protein